MWQRIGHGMRGLIPFSRQTETSQPLTEIGQELIKTTEATPASGDIQQVRPIGKIQASSQALPPEFDLAEVNRIYTVDSYARQAVSRYIEFMFKQGWDFVSENPTTLTYLKTRFYAMAEATTTPTDQLWIEVAEDLVKFHNCFILKARDAAFKWPKGITVRGIYQREPVVGLFVSDPTAFKVKRDKTGMTKQWEFQTAGADKPTKLKPEDVVHIPYQAQRGAVFGHPFLLTAREDIRALRQLEDLVLRMVYRNIFPFIHYKVGTKEAPATDPEIDQAWQYIETAKTEGGLVTSERHEINAVALDKVIDVEPHLRYFESRVFTSVGVPEVLMGRGAGASRATSDNLHVEFTDRVKAYQRVIESYINHFIINEMLLEGGFDPILNPQDAVQFRFREIDADAQIKRETFSLYKYEHGAITEDEMRNQIGMKPLSDRSKLYLNLVTIPTSQAKSVNTRVPSKAATANRVSPQNQHTKNKQAAEEEELTLTEAVFEDLNAQNREVKEAIAQARIAVLGARHGLDEADVQILQDALLEASRG